jgi:hypothetical protein
MPPIASTPMPSAAPPFKNSPQRDMQEVEAPEMFKFSDQHPQLSGILIDISLVTVSSKETTQYMFEAEDGHRVTFLATYDLQRKIRPAHVGHFMWIRYEGEDRSVETQGSPLRKFRVQVSREKEPVR